MSLAAALAKRPHITALNLADNYCGGKGAEALEKIPLKKLNLINNRIGNVGAKSLAITPSLSMAPNG